MRVLFFAEYLLVPVGESHLNSVVDPVNSLAIHFALCSSGDINLFFLVLQKYRFGRVSRFLCRVVPVNDTFLKISSRCPTQPCSFHMFPSPPVLPKLPVALETPSQWPSAHRDTRGLTRLNYDRSLLRLKKNASFYSLTWHLHEILFFSSIRLSLWPLTPARVEPSRGPTLSKR